MKIGIISDSHNYIEPWVYRNLENTDIIIHCGDIENEITFEELKAVFGDKLVAVKGNMDHDLKLPIYKEVCISNNKCIIASHKLEDAINLCSSNTVIVAYGHTHKTELRFDKGIYFINPGSVSFPKFSKEKSMVIIEYTISLDKVEFIFSK